MGNMGRHPLNIVNAIYRAGYTLDNLLSAYPGKDVAYIDAMLRDNALFLERPVLPYGLLGTDPCVSSYCNVAEAGFRKIFREQVWPPPRDKKVIFCFGGSTTLGFCLEDRDTIASRLQELCDAEGLPIEVYNFGSGSYTSRHSALRLLTLVDQGIRPDIALFFDGFNDCYFAPGHQVLISTFDHLYRKEKKRSRAGFFGRLALALNSLHDSTLQQRRESDYYERHDIPAACGDLLSSDGIREALQRSEWVKDELIRDDTANLVGEAVWTKYLLSTTMIRSIADQFRIRPFWFWQPVPYYATRSLHRSVEGVYQIYGPGVYASLVYPWLHRNRFPGRLGSPDFFDLSMIGKDKEGILYVDHGHYTAHFVKIIAQEVFTLVCRETRNL